jgi:hypothetical protein
MTPKFQQLTSTAYRLLLVNTGPEKTFPATESAPIGEKPISFPCGPNPVATTFRDAILALTLGEYSW